MDKNVNYELNQYDFIEGADFDGLMPKVMEALGMTIGTSDKSVKWFGADGKGMDSLEVIDEEEIMNSSDEGGEGGDQGGDGGHGKDDGGDEGGDEPKETPLSFDYVWDESSWNDSYENGGLADYYKACPSEDLEDMTGQGRTPNFNHKKYVGKINGNSVTLQAQWEENCQKVTNVEDASESYYMVRVIDGKQVDNHNGQTWDLYSDIDLTNKVAEIEITDTLYEGFEHTWTGAVNAGAQFPWCVVIIEKGTTGKLKLVYDNGEPVYPWSEPRTFNGGYAIVSVPSTFGQEYLLDENGNTTFDKTKLTATMVTEE